MKVNYRKSHWKEHYRKRIALDFLVIFVTAIAASFIMGEFEVQPNVKLYVISAMDGGFYKEVQVPGET